MRHSSLRAAAVAALLLLPLLALAASSSRQEYLAAVRRTPQPEHGAELFETCAICHGARGNGTPNGDVPRIAGQHFKVLVKQIVDFRHQQRWDIRMERFAERHLLGDAQQIADVAAYVSLLDEPTSHGVGPGDLVAHGAAVYARECHSCHRANGGGDPRQLVPRLAGQHYEYLLRQMYDTIDGRRPNMARAHVRRLARLDRDDLVGLADFLSRAEWDAPVARDATP